MGFLELSPDTGKGGIALIWGKIRELEFLWGNLELDKLELLQLHLWGYAAPAML
jgi:hypothetical protein